MADKKNNENKKNGMNKKEEMKMEKKAEQVAQNNENIIVGATIHGFIYSKPMQKAQEEVVDLGERFGKRTMRWGKGLDCTKILKGEEEVARIFWQKSGDSPKIRILSEKEKHYYMLSYDQTSFIYFKDKKKVVVMDSKLANVLWFFHKNFVVRLAELKGWKLPEKKAAYYQDNGYWTSLEKEYEAEEAARAMKKKA